MFIYYIIIIIIIYILQFLIKKKHLTYLFNILYTIYI